MTFLDILNTYTGISGYSNSEVFTPVEIAEKIINIQPETIFNPDTKFIDIVAKSGSLLVAVYNRLMNSNYMINAFPNKEDRHNHIVTNQLYGIATSNAAASIIRKTFYNDAKIKGNIVSTNNVYDASIIEAIIKKEFKQVKFDVVIGNPPYNNDLYIEFVELGQRLATKYNSMIIPAKWQAKGGAKNDRFRDKIVPYMSSITYYKNSKDVFDIQEWGGVCYFLADKTVHPTKQIRTICPKNKELECDYETHDEASPILYSHKILGIIGRVGTLGEGFKQSLYVKNTDFGESTIEGTLGFRRCIFTGEQERGEFLKKAGYVEVVQGDEVVGYKNINDLFTTDNIDKYKCITSIMTGGINSPDKDGKLLGMPKINIVKPYQVPKGSFPVLHYFDTLEECESFISYMDTKLVSFLCFLGCCGTTLTKEFFRFIPDPEKYDHIFTDDELYKKYNLLQSDIDIIESLIKTRKK